MNDKIEHNKMNKTMKNMILSKRIREYADLLKFEHTIFALPFALSAMLLALPGHQYPSAWTVLGVIAAMVGGRTYAMGLNRLIDARIDGENPRTQNRSIPAGRVSHREAWLLIVFSALLLIVAAGQLPPLCLTLLPVAFLILTIYSFVKLFSPLAHLILGLALGTSAIGGWMAVTGTLTLLPILFGSAVILWVSGFDIIYACQDYDFDRKRGLHSIPVAMGLSKALLLSRILHAGTVLLLVAFAWIYTFWLYSLNMHESGWHFLLCFSVAILMTGAMLVIEHRMIRGDNGDRGDAPSEIRLEKINEAFFNINGKISVGVFLCVLLAKILG